MEKVSETTQKKKSSGYSFPEGSSKLDKGKGKDTEDQSSLRKISPASGGGDDGNSSSSDEESDKRKLWHLKSYQKIRMLIGDNI